MSRSNRYFDFIRLCLLLAGVLCAAGSGLSTAFAQGTAGVSPFGPNVIIVNPSMSPAAINSLLNTANKETQFSQNRYAVLFQPGVYGTTSNPVSAQVGFYESIAGLGTTPDQVTITGGLAADQLIDGNMTQNFWRSQENLAEVPSGGLTAGTLDWGVSQGASLRRMHIKGGLTLANSGPIGSVNACQESSGGFIADTNFDGLVNACSQQQWYTRNSVLTGGFTGFVWNFVFSGTYPLNVPAQSYPGGPNGDANVTNLSNTPVSQEKPFLYLDGNGAYNVFLPSKRIQSNGLSWNANGEGSGTSFPISDFLIASPTTPLTTINSALASGQSLILTPGIYQYSDSIYIPNANTIVLGMGYATIQPLTGAPAITVADVDNVHIAGVLIDAGSVNSPVLLQVGTPGVVNNSHASAPTVLNDVFFRIGGNNGPASATTSLQVDSGNVILDNIWAWRADHGNPGTFGWNVNPAAHGIVVNGSNVTALGLAVEHYQQEQVLWNGDNGETIFYQSELPYDPPTQAAWTNGTQNGYPSYVVSPGSVCTHTAYGLGIYSYFDQGVNIVEDNAMTVPNVTGVNITDVGTVFLNGSGQIRNIINGNGGASSIANSGKLDPMAAYDAFGTCTATTPPVGSTVPLQTIANPNKYNYDTPQIMNALQAVHPDLTVVAAHRGIHAVAGLKQAPNVPENSLESIKYAAQGGWEAVELDVQVTSDNPGVPILSHDKTWGRETCTYSAGSGDGYPYNPWTQPNTSTSNDAKNLLVSATPWARTKYWYFDNFRLRDSVNLVNDPRFTSRNGCSTTGHGYSGEFPPTLADALEYIRKNHIHMVLFLDVKNLAGAAAIWNILYPQNGKPPIQDDQGRPFYKSVIFKMDAKNFPNGPSDFLKTFPSGWPAVNFMPLFTSGGLPEPVPTPPAPPVDDTEAAGFDATADVGSTYFRFGSEQVMIDWLKGMESYCVSPIGCINVVSVEVVMKEPGGILTTLFNAAQKNLSTGLPSSGLPMAVADFNTVGDFYPPDNSNPNQTPQFYRSPDGSCCDYLTHYLYNNTDGKGQIDSTKPFDATDQRIDVSFLVGLKQLGTINSDDPNTLANALAAKGRRETCYMSENYHGGACSAQTTGAGPSNGTYTIANVNSGLAMDVAGNSQAASAAIDQYAANGGANQQWQLTSLGSGLYKLISVNSGLCLDVAGGSTQPGATMDQYTCYSGYTNQQFTIAATSDGNYTIVAQNSGLAVEDPGGAAENSTVLDQYTPNGLTSQEWSFQLAPPPTGTYTLTNVNSGLAMDVSQGSTANGAIIDQYTSLGRTNQQWQLRFLSPGLYNLVSVGSGLCLDVVSGSTQSGAGIDQYTCYPTHTNQQFSIVAATVGGWTIIGKESGLAVEIPGSSTALSTALDQGTGNQGKNQAWNFKPVN